MLSKSSNDYRQLSMFVHHTIKNNDEAGMRLSKTYQSFVAAAGVLRELSFIEQNLRNYTTRSLYNLVFGFFVGVNQHGHSTLFGYALMKDEDIQSFK
ncbi:hypothetical protein Ahy_A09g044562 [Arachis hypogaea]|uniref:Protein FAR1-RELATED SEQUENCE n=1 Tax=Arachis hypogaea TaxID=3818 RepID=A0A445BKA2_ARAHY|nr:hypothetical protein Ahy_A09g044562 [Arachis hypogaea]